MLSWMCLRRRKRNIYVFRANASVGVYVYIDAVNQHGIMEFPRDTPFRDTFSQGGFICRVTDMQLRP